jgi:WD40 repeat protein
MPRYDLFISYSWEHDYPLARSLKSFLETFHELELPDHRVLRPLKTCFDGASFDLSRNPPGLSNASIKEILDRYLEDSEELLVLCSLASGESAWIEYEVKWFVENSRSDRIRVAVTESSDPALLLNQQFSGPIRSTLLSRPRYDFRGFDRERARDWPKVRDFEDEATNLAAHLLGFDADSIRPIWYRERLRKERAQLERVKNERDRALRNQSLFLADLARQEIQRGEITNGLLLALEGLPEGASEPSRPYVPEAEVQLYDAVTNLREKAVMRGHGASIRVAKFSPSGEYIVTCSGEPGKDPVEASARVWRAESGQLVQTIRGHGGAVDRAVFSPDNRHLVTISGRTTRSPGAAILTEIGGSQQSLAISVGAGEPDLIDAVWCETTRSFRILVTSLEYRSWIWDTSLQGVLASLQHDYNVSDGRFSPDGCHLLTRAWHGAANLWNVETGQLCRELAGHKGWASGPTALAWSAQGHFVATGHTDGVVRVWDREKRRPLFSRGEPSAAPPDSEHQNGIRCICFSPDERLVAAGSADGCVWIYSVSDGDEVAVLEGHGGPISCVDFGPGGRTLLTTSWDKTARIWAVERGSELAMLVGHDAWVECGGFHPGGDRVVTGGREPDNTARIWQLVPAHGGTELHDDRYKSREPLAFDPTGRIALTGALGGGAILWDTATGARIANIDGHESYLSHASFCPRGELVVTAGDDPVPKLWDIRSGDLVAELVGHESAVAHTCFSPDGKYLVTTSSIDDTARVWRTSTRDQVSCLGAEGVRGINQAKLSRFAADGETLVTVASTYSEQHENAVRLWSLGDGKRSHALTGHRGEVVFADFSPDGELLVTTSRDCTVILWNVRRASVVHTLRGHTEMVWEARFSPDGRRLVTASLDRTARIWDVESGNSLFVLSPHQGGLDGASFSPTGNRVLTHSFDETARVWDASIGEQIAVLTPATAAAFCPEGRRVLTVSKNGDARLWPVFPSTRALVEHARERRPRELTRSQRQSWFLDDRRRIDEESPRIES